MLCNDSTIKRDLKGRTAKANIRALGLFAKGNALVAQVSGSRRHNVHLVVVLRPVRAIAAEMPRLTSSYLSMFGRHSKSFVRRSAVAGVSQAQISRPASIGFSRARGQLALLPALSLKT